eukprot:CAMPEP_0119476852 /NCGR_PEP_ID=MMETSP1344-20130328/7220_1 /TAXON_ID=236787 /ORGANISM="Florenciella parvula, Strain CCMP2471" /LENGTH=133 /DNA_ID=CAMNT_0007510717 /DNA_START=1 /DNA_END=400 /DNA_ORIENTATION=+
MAQFFAWLGLPPHDFKDAYKNELGYWVSSKKALSKSLKKLDKYGEAKKRYTYRPMLNESKEWLGAFHKKPNEVANPDRTSNPIFSFALALNLTPNAPDLAEPMAAKSAGFGRPLPGDDLLLDGLAGRSGRVRV